MNRSSIRTLCRIWLNEDVEGFYLNTQLNTLINVSNQKVNDIITAIREDFFVTSKTFSITANSKSYSWPTDFGGLRRFEHYSTSNASDIEKIDLLKFPNSEAQGDWPFGQTGKPRRYIPFGDHYDLWPIPDAAYTLRIYYDQIKADLSLDTDSPSSPAKFHDMVALYAAILALPKNHESAGDLVDIWADRQEDLITYMSGLGKGEDTQVVTSYLEGVVD